MSEIGAKSSASAACAFAQLVGSSSDDAGERRLGLSAALGRRRHAAEGDARGSDPPAVKREAEGAHDGGNVLVEALGDLEGAEGLLAARRGVVTARTYSPSPRSCLP